MDHPGLFTERDPPLVHRAFSERGFTVGIGGPVGSGYVSHAQITEEHGVAANNSPCLCDRSMIDRESTL